MNASRMHADLVDRVRRIHAGRIDHIDVVNSGWSNVVVVVNRRDVYRFSRGHSKAQFLIERRFLLRAKEARTFALPIPTPTATGDDYIVYPMIVGERIEPPKFDRLDRQHQAKIIRQLARFLNQLHAFDAAHCGAVAAPYGGEQFFDELFDPTARLLKPDTAARAREFFELCLERQRAQAFEPVVVHSDLATNNILIDPNSPRLAGIIDFSDLALSDPAVDFAGVYRRFGRAFAEELLAHYEHPVESNFRARIRYHALRKLFFVVDYARRYGFEQHIPDLIDALERHFSVNESKALMTQLHTESQ